MASNRSNWMFMEKAFVWADMMTMMKNITAVKLFTIMKLETCLKSYVLHLSGRRKLPLRVRNSRFSRQSEKEETTNINNLYY